MRSMVDQSKWLFQSTLPVRGGTGGNVLNVDITKISIHPPREGRDRAVPTPPQWQRNFNPPSPQGEGLDIDSLKSVYRTFQSTLPARGGTFTYRAV